jgi:UDP-glucose 4-epimerase
MNILLTGVEGFVGRNVAESFSLKRLRMLCPRRDELDLTNAAAVDEYFRKHAIDVVVHCATTLRDGTSYPADTCENNLRMFFNLQRQLTPSVKLINLGSGSEYDRAHWHRKMPEGFFDRYIPSDSHSYSKYLISRYIQETGGENLVSLRIFGIYGKYEDYRYKFISNAIVKNLLGLPIVINQNVLYDYLYVDDFAAILEYFLTHEAKHRTYNVTPTESVDLATIARLVNKASGHESEIQVLHGGLGVEYSGDNQRLLAEIPDFRFTPHDQAICELTAYYEGIRDTLDVEAVRQDAFLDYAKKLHQSCFSR